MIISSSLADDHGKVGGVRPFDQLLRSSRLRLRRLDPILFAAPRLEHGSVGVARLGGVSTARLQPPREIA